MKVFLKKFKLFNQNKNNLSQLNLSFTKLKQQKQIPLNLTKNLTLKTQFGIKKHEISVKNECEGIIYSGCSQLEYKPWRKTWANNANKMQTTQSCENGYIGHNTVMNLFELIKDSKRGHCKPTLFANKQFSNITNRIWLYIWVHQLQYYTIDS